MKSEPFMTSHEAARTLNVKLATVYAYAAKGLLRPHAGRGPGRRSLYLREEVVRLKQRAAARAGHTAVAAGALRWGEPVLDSAITRIDTEAGPLYRGQSAIELSRRRRFEEVAELLFSGVATTGFPWTTPLRPPIGRAPFDVLSWCTHVLSLLALRMPLAPNPEQEITQGRQAVRFLVAALAADGVRRRAALSANTVAQSLSLALTGVFPSPLQEKALNAVLILSADHELNASTFAARVAAGAGAPLLACLVSAMATLSGPLHGSSVLRIETLIEEVERTSVKRTIESRLARGEAFPGFDAGPYLNGDPRTGPLLELARNLARRSARLRRMAGLVRNLERVTGLTPSIDFGFVAMAEAFGLSPRFGACFFAVGRMAGWIAHVLEHRTSGVHIRPRARYVGP
jgi:citrate synthase